MSESLWDGPSITVQGFPWCKHTPKTVGINAITGRILCRRHNSDLSPIDTAGRDAFVTLGDAARWATGRGRIAARTWFPIHFRIGGRSLERWFLKTLINLTYSQDDQIVWALSGIGPAPPDILVQASFGLQRLDSPLGLYGAATVGEMAVSRNEVMFAPLYTLERHVAGGLFHFQGFRFLLYTLDQPLSRTLDLAKQSGSIWEGSSLLYHIQAMNWRVAGEHSHTVEFQW